MKPAAVSVPEDLQTNSCHTVSQDSDQTGAVGLMKPHECLENTQQNDSENITADENESKKSDKKTSSPIQTGIHVKIYVAHLK